MSSGDFEGHVLPANTIERARALSRDEFVAMIDASVLLVRTDEGEEGDLARGLIATLTAESVAPMPVIAFRTVVSAPPRARSVTPAGTPKTLAQIVRSRLGAWPHVVVPLRKREDSGKEFTTRVSIGRAVNNDVVLRHESVSKFHAWIERDEDGLLYVSDAGSSNGTRVNDLRLASRTPTLAPPGADVQFGAITGLLCGAGALWEALQSG